MPRILVRAPDHLGDGVMALPAISAIASLGPTRVEGPAWAGQLYRDTTATFETENPVDIAVLFKPAFSAAWATRHVPIRVGLDTDGRWPLLTHAIVSRRRHRLADFDALAAAVGAQTAARPTFAVHPHDRETAPEIPSNAILLLPLTHSTETVAWPGFRALADMLGPGKAVFAAGPGEEDTLQAIAGPHPTLRALGLGELAHVATTASAVVGNDSGLTHLAAAARRAAGGDPNRVHVVYGSTDARRTGPPETTAHSATRPACWPCYRKRCPFGSPCLDTTVDHVAMALEGRAR